MTSYASKSAHIRALAAEGLPTARIAEAVGVRYQHARKVLIDAGMWTPRGVGGHASKIPPKAKPPLQTAALFAAGFTRAGEWRNLDGELAFEGLLPAEPGVYAFCDDAVAHYVGVATMGLTRRLYFYRKPGITQTTSIRIRALLLEHLIGHPMQVLVASVATTQWNGLPIDMNAGLELGLIKSHALSWNKRGI